MENFKICLSLFLWAASCVATAETQNCKYCKSPTMPIADNSLILFYYTLTNYAGQVIESSVCGTPLAFLYGAGNIVPGLESAMRGKKAGDKFNVLVQAKEGYGMPNPALIQMVPKAVLQGLDKIEVGVEYRAQMPDGPMSVVITKVENDEVTVDGNHPLVGQTLHYAIEIVEVRDASPDELAYGHAHGAGGHQH